MKNDAQIRKLEYELEQARELLKTSGDLKSALEQEIWLLCQQIEKAQRLKKA